MGLRLVAIGVAGEPVRAVVDADRARAYAAATNDANPAYDAGTLAPPVFAVVPAWDALTSLTAAVVPSESLPMVVHGEQDMHFARPLVPGRTVATTAELHSVRVGATSTRFTCRLVTTDDAGPVVETFSTIVVRGVTDGADAGPDKPDHTFPEDARTAPVAERTVHVDDDQTFRYRDASGDLMPIHVDEGFARAIGLPGIIVHGLCTMAMCGHAVVDAVAGGDSARLRRLAVRFARNVLPGSDLVVTVHDAGPTGAGAGAGRTGYAFEARSRGELVVAHGRAEVGDPA